MQMLRSYFNGSPFVNEVNSNQTIISHIKNLLAKPNHVHCSRPIQVKFECDHENWKFGSQKLGFITL